MTVTLMSIAKQRRNSRVITLQALYEIDNSNHRPEEVLNRLNGAKALPTESFNFSKALLNGVLCNKDKIDALIKQFAPAFPIEQISAVDRNILRLAIFEILFDNNVPTKVAINEAIELAKQYGGNNSRKLINGVLGSIVANYEASENKRTKWSILEE
jgi:N utilization substance protein B